MNENEKCGCQTCNPELYGRKMFLCPRCGNKRCPHATHHLNACTGSNESGQKGSEYENVPMTHQPKTEGEKYREQFERETGIKPNVPEGSMFIPWIESRLSTAERDVAEILRLRNDFSELENIGIKQKSEIGFFVQEIIRSYFSELQRANIAEREREELREKLSFYASSFNWEHDQNGTYEFAGAFDPPTIIDADKGEKARKALASLTRKEQ